MRTGRLTRFLLPVFLFATGCSQNTPVNGPAGATTELVTRDHLETVVKLAVAVTNPADRLAVTGSRLDETRDGYEFQPTSLSFPAFHEQFISWRVPYAVRLDKTGHVQEVRQMPENRTSVAVREFSKGQNGDGSDWILKGLGAGVRMTVLIQFKNPVKESKLDLLGPVENASPVFLSGARRASDPIYWSGDEGCFNSSLQSGCAGYSSVAQFRSWVSQLRPEDDVTLSGFGLSVAELRQVAAAGLIYGTIVDGGSPAVIRELKKHPNVSGMWIVDMRPCPPEDECP
ncbi:hypothetical protein AB0M95_03870 [Sphaerisporangium sp. NPDC051017]|uniref:hypothetical protein n=1 Tax=Sphaerisporangium sp. NPDC051017 TaxID=3154636 RepID=UPI00341821DA